MGVVVVLINSGVEVEFLKVIVIVIFDKEVRVIIESLIKKFKKLGGEMKGVDQEKFKQELVEKGHLDLGKVFIDLLKLNALCLKKSRDQ